ncbi:hypothetical protein B0H14DRAFT_3140573 [Mycena olivaceomarginata]|nr:hypothetical protein B0H14DRAFT_3140573 [Mycena olivaceomarginata]
MAPVYDSDVEMETPPLLPLDDEDDSVLGPGLRGFGDETDDWEDGRPDEDEHPQSRLSEDDLRDIRTFNLKVETSLGSRDFEKLRRSKLVRNLETLHRIQQFIEQAREVANANGASADDLSREYGINGIPLLTLLPQTPDTSPPHFSVSTQLCKRQHRAACGLRKPPGGRPGCRWGTARLCVLYLRLQRTSSFPLYPAAAPRSPLPLLRAAICVGVARSPTTHRNPLHRCYSHPATRPVAWKSAVMRSDGGHPHLAPSHRSLHSRIAPGLTMALLFLRSHAAPHLPVPPGNRIGVDANRTAPLHCSPHRHRRRRVSGAPRLLAAVRRSFALYTLSIAVPTGMSTRSTAAQTRCTIHPVAAILDELGADRRQHRKEATANTERYIVVGLGTNSAYK